MRTVGPGPLIRALAATFLLFTCVRAGTPARQVFISDHAVRVTLATEKKEYAIGETMTVRCELENVGSQPFYVPNTLRYANGVGFLVVLQDERGEPVKEGISLDAFRIGPELSILEKVKRDWHLLMPHTFYGARIEVATGTYPSLRPGRRYQIVAKHYALPSSAVNGSELEQLETLDQLILAGERTAEPVWVTISK